MNDYFENIPRASILNLPTPISKLTRLSDYLGGPAIYLKRDDLTGLGLGGNKTRKLEYLIGEAIAQGCDAIIMHGDVQSNCCRQAAAAAAATGLKCHLALSGEIPAEAEGNLLLDCIFGAEIHWCGNYVNGELVPDIAAELRAKGLKPYIIPYGGSNSTGVLGFATAILEIRDQLELCGAKLDYIVTPSSSGGTHAGILLGNDLFSLGARILGIGIDNDHSGEYEKYMAKIANDAAERIGYFKRYSAADFEMDYSYLGEGHGVISPLEKEAMYLTGKCEGILLDPVYNGKAMGALIDMIRKGRFSKNEAVLLWHTGGIQAVFTRSGEIQIEGQVNAKDCPVHR